LLEGRILRVLVVVLAAGLIITSSIASFYLFQYSQEESKAGTYLSELKQASATGAFSATVSILLDFGNGTDRWYNGTQVQPGWNVYLVTVVVAGGNINDTWYPQYGEHLVNGLDGVQNTQSHSWFLFTYNSTSRWQPSPVGADELQASNGAILAWAYCGLSSTYSPTCTSP
jgi:hypothetical protein